MSKNLTNKKHSTESSSSPHPSGSKDFPAPLLSDIDELIQKEKTLLELKLLDQELATENWKTKYEGLKEHVIDDIEGGRDASSGVFGEEGEGNELSMMEKLAEYEEKEINDYYIPTDPHLLLISRIDYNYGNFSRVHFTRQVFSTVMRQLFGPKSSFPDINVLFLDHCELNNHYSESLYNIFKNPKLEGVDLSYNLIDNEMMFQIITFLSVIMLLSFSCCFFICSFHRIVKELHNICYFMEIFLILFKQRLLLISLKF
jgi:hypothetical protein